MMLVTLTTTEIDVKIAVAELPLGREGEARSPVMVALVGDELVFARMSSDEFVMEVAGSIGLGTEGDLSNFELAVSPRALDLALRRDSSDRPSLGGGYLRSTSTRGRVEYVAPCGEAYDFSRRDLEDMLEFFDGA